jgi:hypothetical protein
MRGIINRRAVLIHGCHSPLVATVHGLVVVEAASRRFLLTHTPRDLPNNAAGRRVYRPAGQKGTVLGGESDRANRGSMVSIVVPLECDGCPDGAAVLSANGWPVGPVAGIVRHRSPGRCPGLRERLGLRPNNRREILGTKSDTVCSSLFTTPRQSHSCGRPRCVVPATKIGTVPQTDLLPEGAAGREKNGPGFVRLVGIPDGSPGPCSESSLRYLRARP